jgi:hypothetical protein
MKDNRSYKGHKFSYITRDSIFNTAIAVDGDRVTEWHKSYSEAKKEFMDQVEDIMDSQYFAGGRKFIKVPDSMKPYIDYSLPVESVAGGIIVFESEDDRKMWLNQR